MILILKFIVCIFCFLLGLIVAAVIGYIVISIILAGILITIGKILGFE